MKANAVYENGMLRLKDKIDVPEHQELILLIFPFNFLEENKKIRPEIARKLLRGSGKNEKLNERLLKYRAEDLKNNGR